MHFFNPHGFRPAHPFGPNIGPCGNPACRYCERMTMDDPEPQASVLDLARREALALRQANDRLQSTVRNHDRIIDDLRSQAFAERERRQHLERDRDRLQDALNVFTQNMPRVTQAVLDYVDGTQAGADPQKPFFQAMTRPGSDPFACPTCQRRLDPGEGGPSRR